MKILIIIIITLQYCNNKEKKDNVIFLCTVFITVGMTEVQAYTVCVYMTHSFHEASVHLESVAYSVWR